MNQHQQIPNVKILMYHRVVRKKPQANTHWHYVTTETFRKHLLLIDRLGYTTITFNDYKLFTENKLTLPLNPIVLTFDDGYLDTFENAIPIMKEMGMKGVIFVLGNRSLDRATWDEVDEDDVCRLITNEQLKTAIELGFEIGSHSMNHDKLVELSRNEASYTIQKSKEEIESVIHGMVHTFAYPYGRLDERIEKLVSDSGYLYACGAYTGSPKFGRSTYNIRRLAVNQHTSLVAFAIKLLIPYAYVEWMYSYLKAGISRQMPAYGNQKEAATQGHDHAYSTSVRNQNV